MTTGKGQGDVDPQSKARLASDCSVGYREILGELDETYFRERQEIWQRLGNALQSIETNLAPDRPVDAIDDALGDVNKCLEVFWSRYSTAAAATILTGFPHFEKALYGLEFEREGAGRYRDHFLHMFNSFILGARIISLALGNQAVKLREGEFIRAFFKVAPEIGPGPFGRTYSARDRLFFLWGVIASFHDVGVPVERLRKIQDGLQKFLDYFGLEIPSLNARPARFLLTQLDYYVDLLARFGNGVALAKDDTYEPTGSAHGYMHQVIASAVSDLNQGVMSAVALFKSVTQGFMRSDEEIRKQFPTWRGPFESYVERVLEQDIARAGLAIAFHSLDPAQYPSRFPLSFRKHPLSCLLILCDEIQEYFRPEGTSLRPVIKLRYMPKLEVQVTPNENGWALELQIDLCYGPLTADLEANVVEQANKYLKSTGKQSQLASFEDYLHWYWQEATSRLRRKVSLDAANSPVRLTLRLWREERVGESVKPVRY